MDGYICLRPLTLSGKLYTAGECIPAEEILPDRVRTLTRMKFITTFDSSDGQQAGYAENTLTVDEPENKNPNKTESVINIPISYDDGVQEEIPASGKSVIFAAKVMQMTVEKAVEEIRTANDETALILLQCLDSRKGVKAAAAARIKILNSESGLVTEEKSGGTDGNEESVDSGEN